MGLEKQIKYNCPHCSIEQTSRYYNSVSITNQPELKDRVITGKLNTQQCSNCNKEVNFMSGFLYHDMENRFMIDFNQNEGADELTKHEISEHLNDMGYIYRKVHSYPELIEKIKIFDSNLNDEIIDELKLGLSVMLGNSLKVAGESKDSQINIFFEAFTKGSFKKKLSFIFFLHPSRRMKMDYDLKELNQNNKQKLFDLEVLRK
jgi:hypothetical protein